MVQILGKIALTMLYQLITGPAIVDLFIWSARALAKRTDNTIDDELAGIIEKYLAPLSAPGALEKAEKDTESKP